MKISKLEFFIFVILGLLLWSYFSMKEKRDEDKINQLNNLKPNGTIYKNY